jgi:hypothetical protein
MIIIYQGSYNAEIVYWHLAKILVLLFGLGRKCF